MSLETWKRILIGKAPFEFALEVLLRTIVVYLFLLAAVRLLGKRMSGQVTNLELGVMLTLGAIVSVPMELPERGIVPGLFLLCCIVLLQRAFSELEARSQRAARILIGETSLLVCDGVISPRALARAHLSQQQLLSVLRVQHVRHLGEVERVYLEACGAFSVLRREQPQPGLSLLTSPGTAARDGSGLPLVCSYCGNPAPSGDPGARCQNCMHTGWIEAVPVHTEGNT